MNKNLNIKKKKQKKLEKKAINIMNYIKKVMKVI